MSQRKFTRFICKDCNGWLWTEGIHGTSKGEKPSINNTLRCIDCQTRKDIADGKRRN